MVIIMLIGRYLSNREQKSWINIPYWQGESVNWCLGLHFFILCIFVLEYSNHICEIREYYGWMFYSVYINLFIFYPLHLNKWFTKWERTPGEFIYSYICTKTTKLKNWLKLIWLYEPKYFSYFWMLLFKVIPPHPKSKEILPTMIVFFFSGYWQPFCPLKKGHDSFKVKTWSPYVFF